VAKLSEKKYRRQTLQDGNRDSVEIRGESPLCKVSWLCRRQALLIEEPEIASPYTVGLMAREGLYVIVCPMQCIALDRV